MSTHPFNPLDLTKSPAEFSLPDELWLSILSNPCAFPTPIFLRVMENLIRNPNISSSHLFRADIYYDSDKHGDAQELGASSFTSHLKTALRPRPCGIPSGWTWSRTIVRRLVPRNPNKDNDLVQTVQIFRQSVNSGTDPAERTLVVQLPHVQREEELPWYHPAVQQLAIIHECGPNNTDESTVLAGKLSIHCSFFSSQEHQAISSSVQPSDRLIRTAHNIISTICRHGQGQMDGYTKRVHHDQIIPQPVFQDTYTRLKRTYAKPLIASWAEQTDPSKHVFEDLGIAAFLIELWARMYGVNGRSAAFPGFVDIGCGNGVLVHVLRQEGYEGWGFDARRRKSWATFPAEVQSRLKEMLLVPEMLQHAVSLDVVSDEQQERQQSHDSEVQRSTQRMAWHDGLFPKGTFIISNHADELTPWTPIVASLSKSPFMSIPCCSHSFSGARYRAPNVESVFESVNDQETTDSNPERRDGTTDGEIEEKGKGHASGSLKPKTKGPSAYATLTNWVAKLAVDVGYVPEKEMLRIPSTRNAAVVCRQLTSDQGSKDLAERKQKAKEIVTEALGSQQSLDLAALEWVKRANKLSAKTNDAH